MTQTPPTDGYRIADLHQNSATGFLLKPDQPTLDRLASELGLLALRKLRFEGEINASEQRDWRLSGHLGATVIQPCVVTLKPVTTRIEIAVERQFLAVMEVPDGEDEEEIEMPEDDNCEILGSHINPDAVMTEALALALPLYPRAEGAALDSTVFTEPGKVAMTDEASKPFAGLAGLRAKLGDDDEDNGQSDGENDA